MFELFVGIFILGMVFSFYLNHKQSIDKTRRDLDDLFNG